MKLKNLLAAILVILVFAAFAMGSSDDTKVDQGSGAAAAETTVENALGKYSVVIDSCRIAKDYEGKPVVIVKYLFTNVSDESPASFMFAFDDAAFQGGVGLNSAYVLKDSAKYSADNQTKEIKMGATIEVEVAYELNDTETDVEVEVKELFSFDNKMITKTFSIAG